MVRSLGVDEREFHHEVEAVLRGAGHPDSALRIRLLGCERRAFETTETLQGPVLTFVQNGPEHSIARALGVLDRHANVVDIPLGAFTEVVARSPSADELGRGSS